MKRFKVFLVTVLMSMVLIGATSISYAETVKYYVEDRDLYITLDDWTVVTDAEQPIENYLSDLTHFDKNDMLKFFNKDGGILVGEKGNIRLMISRESGFDDYIDYSGITEAEMQSDCDELTNASGQEFKPLVSDNNSYAFADYIVDGIEFAHFSTIRNSNAYQVIFYKNGKFTDSENQEIINIVYSGAQFNNTQNDEEESGVMDEDEQSSFAIKNVLLGIGFLVLVGLIVSFAGRKKGKKQNSKTQKSEGASALSGKSKTEEVVYDNKSRRDEDTVEISEEVKADLPSGSSAADEILKYKKLLDVGAITQEEYDAKKRQLLNL